MLSSRGITKLSNTVHNIAITDACFMHSNVTIFDFFVVAIWAIRVRTHGSGSILDLFSFRSDPYRSRVHSTRTDPTQRSTDVK